MTTTTGDSSHRYCTPSGTSKSVNVLTEAMCMPNEDSSKEDKEKFSEILDHYMQEED